MHKNLLILLIFTFQTTIKTATNSYDYSSYIATSVDSTLSGAQLTSTTSDQSVVYITQTGISISSSTLTKESGDSSNTENSEFYGINAAVLVNGGKLTMTDGSIITKAKGANALCATNGGEVTITGTTIQSTASSSGRGLHATYGGKITGNKVNISSQGGSCATLATDRGEGTVTCSECTLSTAGAGSPLIYSTGEITITKTTGISTGAQAVVVEGKNTASVLENSELICYGIGNRGDIDKCGIMLYQSMSGDADSGTSTFNCKESSIIIHSSSSVYATAPMFFITNTDAIINLENCNFNYGSNIFLNTEGTSEWGSTGSNGGVVTLNLVNQNVEGDFVVDGCSGLTIILVSSTIKGKINNAKTGAKVEINMDSGSKITLTGNSYYTSLENDDTTNSNIIIGDYTFEKVDESEISRASGSSGGNTGGEGNFDGKDRPSDNNGFNGGDGNPPEKPPGENNNDDDNDDDDEENGAQNFNNFIIVTLSFIFALIL